jgi:hypothetical protein
MNPNDKDKLNQCIDILDTTDLGLSLVWLWTWSTIKNILDDETWHPVVTEDQMWNHLCEAVATGNGFSLEWGAEEHQENVIEWMLNREFISDTLVDDDDDDE